MGEYSGSEDTGGLAHAPGAGAGAVIDRVEAEISAGNRGADLIEWASDLFSESRDPEAAINASIAEFVAAGWRWNATLRQLEKGGWWAFFRSQGALAPPILQWAKRQAAA